MSELNWVVGGGRRGVGGGKREVFFVLVLYLFKFYLIRTVRTPEGGRGGHPRNREICLLRTSRLHCSVFNEAPSTRVMGNGISFVRRKNRLAYSDTCFCRNAGSIGTFNRIRCHRNSALSLAYRETRCSNVVRVVRTHEGIMLRRHERALGASDLSFSHLCGVTGFFSKNALVSNGSQLISS